jgi:hypothetical protein
MNNNQESPRLWLSRASFGISALALAAVVYGGCQERSSSELRPSAEPGQVAAASPKVGSKTEVKAELQNAVAPAPVAAPPSASPAPATPKAASDSKTETTTESFGLVPDSLQVKRLVVTSAVKDREPVAETTLTAGDAPILAFVEMASSADVDQKIVINFEHADGKKVGFVELKVPKEQTRWRTWGQTRNIRKAGTWTAIVSTADGVELKRTTFEVSTAALPSG